MNRGSGRGIVSGQEHWFTAYDEESGEPYYYTAKGQVAWERPTPSTSRDTSNTKAKPANTNAKAATTKSSNSTSNTRRSKPLLASSNSTSLRDSTSSFIGNLRETTTPLKPRHPPKERRPSKLGGFLKRTVTAPTAVVKKPIKEMPKLRVTHTFKASQPDEMSVKRGQVVQAIRMMEGNEWWFGETEKGLTGIFPCAFVEPIIEPPPGTAPPPRAPSKSTKPIRATAASELRDPETTASFRGVHKAYNTSSSPRTRSLQFTIFAHNLAYASVACMFAFGFIGIIWLDEHDASDAREDQIDLLFATPAGVYLCLALAPLLFIYEYAYGLQRELEKAFPIRATGFFILAIPCFMSYPTMIPGACLVFTALSHLKAYLQRETGTVKGKGGSYMLRFHPRSWSSSQTMFLTAFVLTNLGLWIEALLRWQHVIFDSGCTDKDSSCASEYAPFAKAFGQTINFNSALILFPILKTVLTKLYQLNSLGSGKNDAFPLRKSTAFHKLVGVTVGLMATGHIIFHFINFAKKPQATLNAFGGIAWVSGSCLTLTMLVMFSGAPERVRRANFEIFWNSHHGFVVYYAMLLAHGPQFWMWGALPLLLYVSEVTMRRWQSGKVFFLHRVKWSPPVLQLRFFPADRTSFVFKEGQYVHLMIEHVSKSEWHPFTISSAFEDLDKEGFVSLHIRVMGKGSWTYKAKEYFKLLSGARPKQEGVDDSYVLNLTHFDNNGMAQAGKHLGPDALPLISINGPTAAPAQHYDKYSQVMLVGAGIGLTPCSSIIKSILKYKWKKGFKPHVIRFYWVLRHNEIDSFRWFIRLLTRLQTQVIADRLSNALTGHHELEINIFITSAPKNEVTRMRGSIYGTTELPEGTQRRGGGGDRNSNNNNNNSNNAGNAGDATIEAGFDVDIGFSDRTLTLAMLNPRVSSATQAQSQALAVGSENDPSNKLKDIWVWNGRPDWSQIFKAVGQKSMDNHQGKTTDVGVVFCGTPIIGAALKNECANNTVKDRVEFFLHKEKFT